MAKKEKAVSAEKKPAAPAKEQVRLGFIGCGGIMNWHVDRTKNSAGVIVALADPSPAALARLKGKQPQLKDVPEFADWRKMLEAVPLDGVVIGSPHTVHHEQICAALAQGLHVLCEKPMTCTSAHARDVIARAQAAGKLVGIAYQRHFEGGYRFIRELVSSGKLGAVQFLAAYQAQEWLRAVKGTWRQQKALSGGGQLNDSASHLLDMVMWTSGLQAEEVSCQSDFFGTEVDINSALRVRFTNGALGTVSVVGNAPSWWEDFTLIGEEGAVYLRNGKTTWQQGFRKPSLELVKGQDWQNPNLNFVEAILGRAEIGCPPEIGLRVIELTEAAWRSHERGGAPVKVERK